jgi:hypothetical protein
MATVTMTLLHLAAVIDLKQEKMESALTPARREQLGRQLHSLTELFRQEYLDNGLLGPAPRPAPPINAPTSE